MDSSIQQQQQQQQHAGPSSAQGPQGAGSGQSVQNGAGPSGPSHIMHGHLHPMLSRGGHTHAHVFSANPNGTASLNAVDPSQAAQQQVQSPQQSQTPGVNQDGTPIKRRPGRPKGSTKKNLLAGSPIPPKVKRPVGRPRKDGFPAGSVGPTRMKREKTVVSPAPAVPMVSRYHDQRSQED